MKSNWTLEDYRVVKEENNVPNRYLYFLIFMIIGIIMIIGKIDFELYKKYSFIKEKDSFILLINSSQIKDLEKNEWIYIDRKKYHYQIKSVDDNYSNINNEIFETVHVNLNNYKTNAVLTDGYLLKSKKNLYQMVIDFIKEDIT